MSHHSIPPTLNTPAARSKRRPRPVHQKQLAPDSRAYLWNIERNVSRLLKKNAPVISTLLLVGVLIWFFVPFSNSSALADLLGEEGYWETVPPADYYLPGTFNTIEVRSDGKVAIYPTCKIDPQLLARMTLHSHTIDHTFAQRLSKGFDVSDRVREFLPVRMEGRKLRSV